MKSFFVIIIVFLSLISCGKKSDPEYKGNNVIPSQNVIV